MTDSLATDITVPDKIAGLESFLARTARIARAFSSIAALAERS